MNNDGIARLLERGLLSGDVRRSSRSLAALRNYALRARREIRKITINGAGFLLVALALWFARELIGWPRTAATVACVSLILGLLWLILGAKQIWGSQRSAYLSSFLLLEQHDRAVAGLRAALAEGHSILLYLRDFDGEEDEELYLRLEGSILGLIGDSQVMVAVGNPRADQTMRLTPISRLAVFDDHWKEVVRELIDGAARVIVVAGKSSEGLQYELEQIRLLGAQAKTLVLDMPEVEKPVSTDAAFRWRTSLREFGGLNPVINGWLGDLRWVTVPVTPRPLPPVELPMSSRGVRYLPARLYLLGLQGVLPRSDLAFYRRGLKIPATFDPFSDIWAASLAQVQIAFKTGQLVPRSWPHIKPRGDSDPDFAKATDQFNKNQLWMNRMDYVALVLSDAEVWKRVRAFLRPVPAERQPFIG